MYAHDFVRVAVGIPAVEINRVPDVERPLLLV
jgi:hypothetical protein